MGGPYQVSLFNCIIIIIIIGFVLLFSFSSVPADPAKAPDSTLYSYQTAQKGEKFWFSVSR